MTIQLDTVNEDNHDYFYNITGLNSKYSRFWMIGLYVRTTYSQYRPMRFGFIDEFNLITNGTFRFVILGQNMAENGRDAEVVYFTY